LRRGGRLKEPLDLARVELDSPSHEADVGKKWRPINESRVVAGQIAGPAPWQHPTRVPICGDGTMQVAGDGDMKAKLNRQLESVAVRVEALQACAHSDGPEAVNALRDAKDALLRAVRAAEPPIYADCHQTRANRR
jgi:hypothetical protein